MSFIKKILNNYLNEFFEEKAIDIMCWDSKTNEDIRFYTSCNLICQLAH
jgi:hypothetical protein